jgi:hypothetical protein
MSAERLYNVRMLALRILPFALVLTIVTPAQQTVFFATEDGGQVCADLYGQGSNAVVLTHGGRFHKESWHDQALSLASAGFRGNYSDRQKIRKSSLGSYPHSWISDNGLDTPGAVEAGHFQRNQANYA